MMTRKWILILPSIVFGCSIFYNCSRHQIRAFMPKFSILQSSIAQFKSDSQQKSKSIPKPLSEVESIYWAVVEYHQRSQLGSFNSSTKARNSRYYILDSSANFSTGDILRVFVETFNQLGQKQTYGGDFLIARAFNTDLQAGVKGSVLDMNDGSYLVTFPLFWQGNTRISIRLYHSAQAAAVIRKLRENYPHRMAYRGIFISQGQRETSDCYFEARHPGPICDFSDLNSGVQWICGKPPSLSCDYFRHMENYLNESNILSKDEEMLLESSNILTEVTPGGAASVFVHKQDLKSTFGQCHIQSLKPNSFSGFFLNNRWIPSHCQIQYFDSPDKTVQCLKGKKVFLIGDSTTRQWWEYLLHHIPSLKAVDVGRHEWYSEHLAIDVANDIVVQWKTHGMPWQTGGEIVFFDLHPAVNQINTIFGGPDVVLVFTFGPHFSPFPLRRYIRALIKVRTALQKLLIRNPETIVILKNTNTRKVYSDILHRSDLLSSDMNKAFSMVFKGMKVGFVDAWDMTVAYDSWDIHPSSGVVKNEIDLFLSYVCHE
ncbi:NXPE family member 4-like isoform X2 [Protopterus annectens]|uniref:NXPE family member 4-like isoform X2 n=1 Tax=Protopterus annectens TaxID=7888 RepID=UPI001CFBF5D8|nr:NXPE family member 4-like isoform X2 [Protopterus annectens]